jgi:hypothetical protein
LFDRVYEKGKGETMKNEILYRGFESIPSRKGRGGVYQYIRWQDVADRMNEAFGTSWSSEVVSQEIIGNNIVVRVRVSIFDANTATFTSQEGFGGATNDDRSEAGNPFKAAYSKALKDACKKWGLGLYLEDSDEGGSMVPQQSSNGYYHSKENPTPPTAAAADVHLLAPEVQHMAGPGNSGGLPTPPGVNMPTSQMGTQSLPVGGLPTPPGTGLPTPPNNQVVQESVVLTQQPLAQSIPAVPVAPSTPELPPQQPQQGGLPTPPQVQLTGGMPMSKVSPISTGEPEKISDVQKAALHGILSYKGVEYETLAKEAFEANGVVKDSIPSPDDLTYQEAVFVVKYGNDKFRRR